MREFSLLFALLALLLTTIPALPATADDRPADDALAADAAIEAARGYRQAHAAEILAEYARFLEIPNVARDLPNIERNAEVLVEGLRQRGISAELWRIEGVPPIVYGRKDVPGATRTIGIYLHYDGQPVDTDAWHSDPWTPTLRTASLEDGGTIRPLPAPGEAIDLEWRLYARAAGDDKIPWAALTTALDALEEAGIAVTSNLVFFFEGEEEAGSTHLEDYMRAHRDALEVDVWLICDGPIHQSRQPQLVFGVRGVTGLEITTYGATRYLHSGHYGNWAPNPGLLLAQLLASMKNADGDVVIDRFYETTTPMDGAERRAIAAIPDIDAALREELGLARTDGGNAPLAERLRRPSLNIRGMVSGAIGEAARNVIPNEATASLDVRMVRGNAPEAMLDTVEAHIAKQGFHIVRETPDRATRLAHPKIARVVRQPGYPAAGADLGDPRVQPVIAAARRAAGDDLILLPTLGGSLPLYLFGEVLDAPVVIVPIANHDNNQHAPDENIRIGNLWYGIELMAALLTLDAPEGAP